MTHPIFRHPHDARLNAQIGFIVEIDKAKAVLRQNKVSDGSRRENDAEHSWHLCMMALLLAEYANEPIDVGKVIRMLLVHDLVEIDAGDTFAYDIDRQADKAERERAAADRIFGLLPEDQGKALRSLWEEFEARESPEARFAAAMDRLQPMMLNFASRGDAWLRHGVSAEKVRARNEHIKEGSLTLWEYARGLIDEAVRTGYLPDED